MNNIKMALILLFIVACDPLGKGYRKNPAFVLDEAFRAITNLDKKSFREVTGKEALCLYGNDLGLEYLKQNLDFELQDIDVIRKITERRHFSSPLYVGFWSYYQERYSVEIYHETTKDLIVRGIVDCDFGTEDQKNDRLLNQKPKKYKKKECRIVKIIPTSFPALSEQRCSIFKINQSH